LGGLRARLVSEISAFIRTDRKTVMARSPRLMILIKNIYTLCGRKRFLLPVTYFPTNLVHPFSLRVTGIKISNTNLFSSNYFCIVLVIQVSNEMLFIMNWKGLHFVSLNIFQTVIFITKSVMYEKLRNIQRYTI